jgi:hypothetical protein
MAEQQLHGAQILGTPVNQRRLGPPHRMRAVLGISPDCLIHFYTASLWLDKSPNADSLCRTKKIGRNPLHWQPTFSDRSASEGHAPQANQAFADPTRPIDRFVHDIPNES